MSSFALPRRRVNFIRKGNNGFEKEMLSWCHGSVRIHGTLTNAYLMEKTKKNANEINIEGF